MSYADHAFREGFLHGQGAQMRERERVAYLLRPSAPNPPKLFTPTRCRVLRPFCISGIRVEPGEIVTLPKVDAESMRAIGRVEIFTS